MVAVTQCGAENALCPFAVYDAFESYVYKRIIFPPNDIDNREDRVDRVDDRVVGSDMTGCAT